MQGKNVTRIDMKIEITNLALMETIELDLTPEQSEKLKSILVSGNFYIRELRGKKNKVRYSTCTPMNIDAKQGHKVIVTEWSCKNGTDYDFNKVMTYLSIGKQYEVTTISKSTFVTDVSLKGIEGVTFNSVNFEDYSVDSE